MYQTAQRRRVNPRALTGKIFCFNGIIFLVVGVVIGSFALFSQSGATSTHGNGTAVTGLLPFIFAGLGLLEVLTGLVVWLLPGGESPPASVVNQFYTALENQDYTTAYQCLDLSQGGLLGKLISEAEFVESAQAYDAERGSITAYSLAGVQANPSRRVYTIKVTRGSSAYRTRLILTGQGPNWKVVSFDRF